MLVLSRKVNQRIFIGDNVSVTIVAVDRGKVRVGIEAPPEVAIYRQESLPVLGNGSPPSQAVCSCCGSVVVLARLYEGMCIVCWARRAKED